MQMSDNTNYFLLKDALKRQKRYDRDKTTNLIAFLPTANQHKKVRIAQEIIDNNLYFIFLNVVRYSGFVISAYGHDTFLSVYNETIISLKKALVRLKRYAAFPTIIWGVCKESRDKVIQNEIILQKTGSSIG